MENNQSVIGTNPIKPQVEQVSNTVKVFRFLVILAVISPLVYTNYVLRNKLEKYTSQTPAPTPTTVISPSLLVTPTPTESKPDQWQMAKYGGVFSYMYPTGWHVAELWPEASGGPIRIAMDPKPITTAPMDGPANTFNIYFFNGLPNPDAKLSELKAQFKPQFYTDVIVETIDSVNGPILYQSGKVSGEYMSGTKVETYLFTVKKSNSDPQNVQVMQASLNGGDQKLSEMFRNVVLSFKPL